MKSTAKMNYRHCLFLFLAILISAAAGARREALVGSWKPIEDIKDPHVVEIGKFAVTEYNKQQSKTALKFKSVIKGETQVVSGMNYRLIISANDGADLNNYEAVVWERAWLGYMNLTSFKPV